MALASVRKRFAYNEWAWQRVFPRLANISTEEYFKERPFFWSSLHGLTVHCYGAEWIWLQRVLGTSPDALPGPAAFSSLDDVLAAWDPIRAEWRAYVNGLDEDDLGHLVHSRNTKGESQSLILDDLLHHVMNHATEHRSQMTPTLAQLGHPTEPLDYLIYARIVG